MKLTADAIHNWGEAYVMRRYAALPAEVQAAAREAMVRHHRQGTSAQAEAETLNTAFALRDEARAKR